MHMETAPKLAGIYLLPTRSNSTYVDLVAYFANTAELSLPKGSAANLRSSLNQFLVYQGRSLSDVIGAELGPKFVDHLFCFMKNKKEAGASDGALANSKSDLKKWHKMYVDFIKLSSMPHFEELHEAVAYYCDLYKEKNGKLNYTGVSKAAGFNKGELSDILRRKAVGARSGNIDGYEKLERLLNAPATAFTRFVWERPANKSTTCLTEFGQRLSDLKKAQYRLTDVPEQLGQEIKNHYQFKTANSPELERNQSWREKSIKELRQGDIFRDYYTSADRERYAPSAKIFMSHLRNYFGYLVQKGLEPEKLSLANLIEPALLRGFLDFMSSRHGFLTATALEPFKVAGGFLLEEYGFLRQQPEYAARLLKPVATDKWDEECCRRRVEIMKIMTKLYKDGRVKPGRRPLISLKDILDRQHPITALLELTHNMREHLQGKGRLAPIKERIVLERDTLVLEIMTAQPLRVQMFYTMTYNPIGDKGNLYKRPDGAWAIKFEPEDFKNEKGAAQKPYDVPLPENLWPKIEYYLAEIRPQFNPPSNNDKTEPKIKVPSNDDETESKTKKHPINVFVPFNGGQEGAKKAMDEGRPSATDFISTFIENRSRRFLPGCKGFRPHAARHIVATDYIRNNPNGFQVAADVLHDTLTTVLKHYAHLKAEDGHKYYRTFLNDVRIAWEATI